MKKPIRLTHGVALCLLIAIISKALSFYLPLGSVAVALLLGVLAGNSVHTGEKFKNGILFSEKVFLSLSIAFMGVNLDYFVLQELGGITIALIVIAIGFSTTFSIYIGRIVGVKYTQALLVGIGNGICGSSAIAATNHIIKADDDVGLAVSVINFLGTIGMLILPLLGKIIFGFTDVQVGILVGNTLQAVGQAAAGGFSVSDTAGQTAIIVKMGRILMLTPFLLILIVSLSNKGTSTLGRRLSGQRQRIPFLSLDLLFSLFLQPSIYLLKINLDY